MPRNQKQQQRRERFENRVRTFSALTGEQVVLRVASEKNLKRARLSGRDLTKVNLTRADLTRADLTNANLLGVDLTKANLARADLARADLTNANLLGANLTKANLARADLTNADLTGATLQYADLSNADLTRANLSNANLSGANLSNADLTNAKLNGADLYGANLRNANLHGANFSNANLRNASLSEATLQYADLTNANLTFANLSNTNLANAKLDGADLSKAKLTRTDVTKALLKANLTKRTGRKRTGRPFHPSNKDGPRYRRVGNELLQSNQYQQAVSSFGEAIKLDALDRLAYIGRAKAYEALGQQKLAENDLLRAKQIQDIKHGEGQDSNVEETGWEILPPGWWKNPKWRNKIASQFQHRDLARSFFERLDFLESFSPQGMYRSAFNSQASPYYAFVFARCVVAENPLEGNAIYVVRGLESWQSLLRLSKEVLRREYGHRVRKIVHRGNWKERFREELLGSFQAILPISQQYPAPSRNI